MNIRPNALMIARAGDKILVQKFFDSNKEKTFYRLLGGGVDFGETSEEAIRREFIEEIKSEIQDLKLLDVYENIFNYNGKDGHEITFLYKGSVDQKFQEMERVKILDKEGAYAEWIDVSDVIDGKLIVYPENTINFL